MRYDVIILGAGINGCAVARELSKRGKKVAVIEKKSIGCGTSSHSSRLIHGGLRYLEHANFGLVYEALHDRTRLVETYPDLVELKAFTLPVYAGKGRPWFMMKMGLFLYDLLSGFKAPHRTMKRAEFERDFSVLKTQGLTKVFSYYDAQTDDLKLTQIVAQEAKAAGAEFFEHTSITDVSKNSDGYTVKSDTHTLETRVLINATGPWIDEVNSAFKLPARYKISKVSGIHLVIKGQLVPQPLFLQTDHERIFFVLPQVDHTIIGTTERLEEGATDTVEVHEEDISYLLNAVNDFLKTPLKREEVIDTFVGIRALIESKKTIGKASREYKIDVHKHDNTTLLQLFGGKLTTHWALSQKVADKLGF